MRRSMWWRGAWRMRGRGSALEAGTEGGLRVVAGVGVGAVRGVRPVDRLFGVYALLSGLAFVFPHRPAWWPLLAGLHIVIAAWALGWLSFDRGTWGLRPRATRALRRRPEQLTAWRGSGFTRHRSGLVPFLADAYPLLLIPALYAELAALNLSVHGGRYFDEIVLRWEGVLFGGQPSTELWQAFPSLFLSEFLHGAYLSYYAIIYGPPLVLYLTGRLEAFREVVFAVMLTFFAHYIVFIFFPVQGPRYLFPAPDGALADGLLFRLTHSVLETGSSQGAAFPSAHVGVAFAQAVLALRYLPRLAPWLFVISGALAVSTVYGGFHYAVDALAGLVLALMCVGVAPRLKRALSDPV